MKNCESFFFSAWRVYVTISILINGLCKSFHKSPFVEVMSNQKISKSSNLFFDYFLKDFRFYVFDRSDSDISPVSKCSIHVLHVS